MKRICIVISVMMFLCILSSCQKQPEVSLLYSSSYDHISDFTPVTIITTYDAYIDASYPIELEQRFFNDYVLFTHSMFLNESGVDLYVYDHYEVQSQVLNISYAYQETSTTDSMSYYAMIYAIDKELYDHVDDVIVTTSSQHHDVMMLYSGSYVNYHEFDVAVETIITYDDYENALYPYPLNQQFFDQYMLYTYSFMYSNLGKNIFNYQGLSMTDNVLTLYCPMKEGIISPAFGSYGIVFAIKKEMYEEVNQIELDLEGSIQWTSEK